MGLIDQVLGDDVDGSVDIDKTPWDITDTTELVENPEDVLSVADMVMDMAYYAMMFDTSPSFAEYMYQPTSMAGRWEGAAAQTVASSRGHPRGKEALPGVFVPPAKRRRVRDKGTVVSTETDTTTIPPSTIHALRRFLVRDIHDSTRPVFHPKTAYAIKLQQKAWEHRITAYASEYITPKSTKGSAAARAAGKTPLNQMGIALSDVTHDNCELRWGRYSRANPDIKVPDCIRGAQCEACKIIAHQGPLQQYLTVGQEREFARTGRLPPRRGMCLLCHRLAVYTCYVNGVDNTAGIDVHNSIRPFLPAFYNLVDMPGGYKRAKMITTDEAPFIAAPVVMPSVLLTAERCGTKVIGYNGWYVDQRELIYAPGEASAPPPSTLN